MPRLGWFRALTQSDRNCRRTRSPKWKSFARERFNTLSRGPRSEFLTSFPKANSPPGAALAKAAVLNHSLGPGLLTCVEPMTLGNQLQPLFTSPPEAVPPTLQPVILEFWFVAFTTVKGFPLWAMNVPAILHPPTTSSITELPCR